jgi:hypothetical protein
MQITNVMQASEISCDSRGFAVFPMLPNLPRAFAMAGVSHSLSIFDISEACKARKGAEVGDAVLAFSRVGARPTPLSLARPPIARPSPGISESSGASAPSRSMAISKIRDTPGALARSECPKR